jgi:hypothetical protein
MSKTNGLRRFNLDAEACFRKARFLRRMAAKMSPGLPADRASYMAEVWEQKAYTLDAYATGKRAYNAEFIDARGGVLERLVLGPFDSAADADALANSQFVGVRLRHPSAGGYRVLDDSGKEIFLMGPGMMATPAHRLPRQTG